MSESMTGAHVEEVVGPSGSVEPTSFSTDPMTTDSTQHVTSTSEAPATDGSNQSPAISTSEGQSKPTSLGENVSENVNGNVNGDVNGLQQPLSGHISDKPDVDGISKPPDTVPEATLEALKAHDAYSSGEETEGLLEDLAHDTRFKRLSKPLHERVKKAQKRVTQHHLYTELVEDRLANVEAAIARLISSSPQEVRASNALPAGRRSVSPMQQDTGNPAHDAHPRQPAKTVKPCIARMTMEQFKPLLRRRSGNVDDRDSDRHVENASVERPAHTLETLVDEFQPNIKRRNLRHDSKPSNLQVQQQDSAANLETYRRVPERVRVNSERILGILEKVIDMELDVSSQNRPPLSPMVFLRPFKLFMTFASKIKQYASELAEKHLPSCSGPPGEEASIDSSPNVESKRVCGLDPIDPTMSKEALIDIQLLVELIDFDLKGLFDLQQRIKDGAQETIVFKDLWFLFSSGENVCDGRDPAQAYRVVHYTGGRPFLSGVPEFRHTPKFDDDATVDADDAFIEQVDRKSPFRIQCFRFDFNGKTYSTVEEEFEIAPYDGERPIHTLPIFPLRYRMNSAGYSSDKQRSPADFGEHLLSRGKKFVSLSKVTHMQYSGQSLDERKDEIDSEVVIDFSLALSQNPEKWTIAPNLRTPRIGERRETIEEYVYGNSHTCDRPGCCSNDFIHRDQSIDWMKYIDTMNGEEEILVETDNTDHFAPIDFALLPRYVYGYVMRDRNWAKLNIDLVHEVKTMDGGLDALHLPEGHQDNILAMVENHSRGTAAQYASRGTTANNDKPQDQMQFDLIPAKGKGLVILLHGPPGVGKTSTAEAISSHTKRPLLPITCGDLGETAEKVDSTLKHLFQLAHKWGCVLLLDEADVFLQRRSKVDLVRNAIVSVFLRVLEYFPGILFLTTNRTGTIDPAFKSRIHMSLYYPSLDKKATANIWKWHVDNVMKHKPRMIVEDKEILKYGQKHYGEMKRENNTWNGRQIRNAFQTAVALAEYDNVITNQRHGVEQLPHLQVRHFETVAKASKEFDQYLKSTWGGHDEDDLARRFSERSYPVERSSASARSNLNVRGSGRDGGSSTIRMLRSGNPPLESDALDSGKGRFDPNQEESDDEEG